MSKFNFFSWYNGLANREKKVFQGAAGCILLLLVDMTVVTPVWDTYSLMEDQIAEAEGALTRNLVNLGRKEAVEAGYERYRSFVRTAGSDEEENAALLSMIEQVARAHQVVLADIKPRETKVDDFHKEYIAELDAEAEMKNLVNFIHEMEKSDQIMKVLSAKLSAKEANSPVVKARITVAKTTFLGGL